MTQPIADKPVSGDRPDVRPAWSKVEPQVLRRLSKVDGRRTALAIGGTWLSILVVAAAAWHWWHPVTVLLAVLFIGARQHDLLVIMHDAAHHRLTKKRSLNDWISELFCAWPFVMVSTHGYRANHWAHHRHLNTTADPDLVGKTGPSWTFPMPARSLGWWLATDAIGLAQVRVLAIARRLRTSAPTPTAFKVGRLVFLAISAVAVTILDAWPPVLLFWVLPFCTWAPTLLRLRAIVEHYGIHADLPVGTRSRTVLPSLLDRVFIVNQPVWFHSEHHFHPSVPLHHLPELHAHLMRKRVYREHVHVTAGYARALWEVTVEGWRGPQAPVEGTVAGLSM